jgi:hypothetical protein
VKKSIKKILLLDENVFSQVCHAILQLEGYEIETNIRDRLQIGYVRKFGLIITSYPFCIPLLKELREFDIPKIILSDHLNKEVITLLKSFTQSFCMIKPIDYNQLRSLVKKILTDNNAAFSHSLNIL